MKRFQNVLAILPEGAPEEDVLSWAGAITRAANTERLTVLRALEPILREYPEREPPNPDPKSEQSALAEKLAPLFPDLNLTVKVKDGNLLTEVLHELSGGDFDLVIVPLGDTKNRNFVLRLSRKSPAGVLAVPANCKAPPSSILVGMDCSDLSLLALEWAEAFASLSEGDSARLEATNVFSVPRSSRAAGTMGPEGMKAHIERIATRQLHEAIETSAKQPERWVKTTTESNLAGSLLSARANKSHSGLLVVGSQGQNAFAIALLGSDAADVIRNSERPILIVKMKNQSLPFLRSLLGLSSS